MHVCFLSPKGLTRQHTRVIKLVTTYILQIVTVAMDVDRDISSCCSSKEWWGHGGGEAGERERMRI